MITDRSETGFFDPDIPPVDDIEGGFLSVQRDPALLDALSGRIVQLVFGLFERRYIDHALFSGFTSHPGVRFAEWLRRLLALEALAEELVHDILPRIHQNTRFESGLRYERASGSIRGPLDVGRTIKADRFSGAAPALVEWVTRRVEKTFDTPENRFVAMTLMEVIERVRRLLFNRNGSVLLDEKETLLLSETLRHCRRAFKNPLLIHLKTALEDGFRAGDPDQRRRLEQEARERILIRHGGRHDGYRDLLRWWERYDELDLGGAGRDVTPPSRAITPERGYELLVLLEIVLRLGRHGRVRQIGELSPSSRKPDYPVFECRFADGSRWEIYYQTAAPLASRRIKPLTGIPDFILRHSGTGRMALGDAKLYTASSYGAAFFKMMGYMYQFSYPDAIDAIAGGTLFFPGPVGQESGHVVWTEPGSQIISSLTIPVGGLQDKTSRQNVDRWIAETGALLAEK